MSLSALAENADERRRRQNRESQQRCRESCQQHRDRRFLFESNLWNGDHLTKNFELKFIGERRRQREPSQHLSRSTGSTARRPCKQHSLPSDPSPNITEGPQIVCKVSSISDASSEGFLSKMSSPSRSLPPGQPLSWSMPFEDTVLADTFANSHSAIPLSPMFYPQERITRDLGSSLRTSMESYDTISRDIPSPVGNQSQKYRCTCSHKKDCKGRKGHYRLAASISSGSSAHMSPYDVHVHQRESEDTEEYGPKLLVSKPVNNNKWTVN